MKHFYTLILSLTTILAAAQTTHNVEVFSFGFNPEVLTIAPGDEVIWTNTQGNHNVDGNTADFPNNPEGFGNSIGGPGWTYSFTFNLEGTYNYQCTPHAQLMQAVIIVEGNVTSVSNVEEPNTIKPFPNPATDFFAISNSNELSGTLILEIFDITGKKAMQQFVTAGEQIDIDELNSGIYILNVTTPDQKRLTGKLMVQ